MLEAAIEFLRSVPWYWVLVFAFFITMLENIFPPSPSDTLLIFTGTLVGIDMIGFIPLLICATLGSMAGFTFMFWLGYRFGISIIDSGKISFINRRTMRKSEEWFQKYGYFVIIVNRFLSGTRAVISFFAGITKLSIPKTILLSSISALVWNSVLIILGVIFGANWKIVNKYVATYSRTVTIIIAVVFLVLIFLWYRRRKKKKSNLSDEKLN